MVEDRITDGKRIAQLLASELSGLERGSLGEVSVVDADREAAPSPEGTFAYGVALDGERIADVFVHETTARMDLTIDSDPFDDATDEDVNTDGLDVRRTDDGLTVHVEYGAAVKRAVDLLVSRVETE